MITCYVLVAISGLGLMQIGLNHYFDFFVTNRISFDLIISFIFIAAQTLVMFFFVGTGVNVREYLENGGAPSKTVKEQMNLPSDFVYDAQDAIDNPESASAKVMNKSQIKKLIL